MAPFPRLLVAACLAAWLLPVPSAAAPAAAPGPFTTIPSPAAPGSGQSNLAVGADGAVWMSWLEPSGAFGKALKASRLDGGRWSKPITVVTGDSLVAIGPDIPALLPLAGQRLAALYLWRFPAPGPGREVRLIQSADGGRTWGPPVVAHGDHTPTEHGFASLVADPLGARAVWLDGRKSSVTDSSGRPVVLEEGIADMVLRSAVLAPDNKIADERELDARVCDCCPTAATAIAGGALIAYRDRSSENVRDISVLRYEGGAWAGPFTVHNDGWKIDGCPVNGPGIAAAGERVAVAWYTGAGDTSRVQFAFSQDGGRHFGAAVRLDRGEPIGRVSTVLLADGGALVAWLEATTGGFEVVTRTVSAQGVVGAAATAATIPAGRGAGFPHLARSGNQVLLTWTEPGKPAQVRTALARLGAAPTR